MFVPGFPWTLPHALLTLNDVSLLSFSVIRFMLSFLRPPSESISLQLVLGPPQPRKQLLWCIAQLGLGSAGLELVPLFSDVLGARSELGFQSGKALEHQHSWTSLNCWISKHEAVHLTAPHRVSAHCLFMLALSHPWQRHRNVTWKSGKKKRVIDVAASCRQKWQMQYSGGFSVTIFIYIASPTSRIGRTLSHVHSQAPMGEAALYSWMKVLCLTTRSILMCF